MRIGHIIKAERLKLEMKQLILAKGICSPSYLSKIEQGHITPSEDILSLLLGRLGIDLKEIIEKKNNVEFISQELLKKYQEVVTRRDAQYATEQLEVWNKSNKYYEEKDLYYTLKLILIRFKLIANKELCNIKKEIEDIKKVENELNDRQEFLLIINEGILFYKSNKINKSISLFEKALKIDLFLEEWELAELHYIIGLAYITDNRLTASIYHIHKATDYFKSKFLMKRVIDCYTLKGIFYKRSNNFDKAENCYLELIDLCNNFNLHNRLGDVYHNLGSLYMSNHNEREGISNLLSSLQYYVSNDDKLITIWALVSAYFKMGDDNKVIYWCNQGLTISEGLSQVISTPYSYHFNFYKSLYSINELTEKIATDTIEYFVSLENYHYAQIYSIILANKLYDLGKYKLSALFFRNANEYGYLKRT